MWTTDELVNESDVEQKFIYPLLVSSIPLGFGLPDSVVQTKANIRRFSIGKGADLKLYFPDYLIVVLGFPLVVIEAKHPNESVEEGYREARLYAAELNSLYQHGVAPTQLLIVTNGIELWYGYSDQQEPINKFSCKNLGVYSPHLASLIDIFSWEAIQKKAKDLAKNIKSDSYFKPTRLLGGVAIQKSRGRPEYFWSNLNSFNFTDFQSY